MSAQPNSGPNTNEDLKTDFDSNNDSDEGIGGDETVATTGSLTNGLQVVGETNNDNNVTMETNQAGASASSTSSSAVNSGSGPLRSSVSTSTEQQSQMNSFISDSIHKLNSSSGGGIVIGGDNNCSTSSDSLPHHQSVQSLQSEDSESTITSSLDSNSTVTSCSTVTPSEPNTYTDEDEHALNSDLLSSKVSSVATSQSAAAVAAIGASSSAVSGEMEVNGEENTKTKSSGNTENSWDDTCDMSREEEDSDDEYSRYCRTGLTIDPESKERGKRI